MAINPENNYIHNKVKVTIHLQDDTQIISKPIEQNNFTQYIFTMKEFPECKVLLIPVPENYEMEHIV